MPALTDAEDFPDDDCLVGSGQPIKVQTAASQSPSLVTLQKVSLALAFFQGRDDGPRSIAVLSSMWT